MSGLCTFKGARCVAVERGVGPGLEVESLWQVDVKRREVRPEAERRNKVIEVGAERHSG